jgi:TP901 family phage tail tape measure protein
MDSVGLVARYGAISQTLYGIQAAFAAVGKEILRFDQSIADSQAILQYSRVEATKLAFTIDELSIAYGTSADDITKAALALGRAGVGAGDSVGRVRELTDAMELLTAMSIVTGDSISDGANAMSSLISVYGDEAIAATEKYATKTQELGNNMAAVANATRLGIADFTTISNYALTSAEAIGLTSKEFFTLSGALSKVGLNASTIGTNIRRLDKLVSDSSKDIQALFIGLNMSQAAFAANMKKDALGTITDLSKRMDELDKKDALNNILPKEVQLRSTLKSLLEIYNTDGIKAMQKEMDKYGSVTEQAKMSSIGLSRAIVSIGNTISQSLNTQTNSLFTNLFGDMTASEFENIANTIGTTVKYAIDAIILNVTVLGVRMAYLAIQTRVAATGLGLFATAARAANTSIGRMNLILLAITVAYEAYVYFSKQSIETTEDLGKVATLTTKELQAMTKAQQQVAYDELLKKRGDILEDLLDLEKELAEVKRFNAGGLRTDSELAAAQAEVDTKKQLLEVTDKQLTKIDEVGKGIHTSVEETESLEQ